MDTLPQITQAEADANYGKMEWNDKSLYNDRKDEILALIAGAKWEKVGEAKFLLPVNMTFQMLVVKMNGIAPDYVAFVGKRAATLDETMMIFGLRYSCLDDRTPEKPMILTDYYFVNGLRGLSPVATVIVGRDQNAAYPGELNPAAA